MGGSKPQFENCLFQGNRTYGGVCGISGSDNIGGYPMVHYAIDSFGGAVYMASDSEAKFTGCTFIDNEAHTRGQIPPGSDANVPDTLGVFQTVLFDSVVSYGGGICAEGTAKPVLENCTFTNNRACAGGAIYSKNSIANISKCTFENCVSMLGGGISLVDSNSILFECDFSNNQAVSPPQRGGAGQGGAIYCISSTAKFYDCKINNNQAFASGGGAYFRGESEPNMHNCLITYNTADRDGGGISANWDVQLTLSNCTIVNNSIIGGGFASNYGGGLSCAYYAYTKVINSILWNNNAQYGPEISIGSNFDAADKPSAEVSVSYSDVMGGDPCVFVDTAHGCVLNWDAGNLAGTSLTHPLFVTGYWGNYYLMQIAANDPCQSPCVDAGLGSAISNGMYRHTTRTDHVIDIADSNVDMGYHYTLSAEILGDFNYDGIVNLEDLGLLMLYWLQDDCTFPYWCYGTDLNKDGEVDFEDYALFAENYGQIERTPPQPNPMTWAINPHSIGLHEITMKATKATDSSSGSAIEYYFKCVSGSGGHDRDWGIDPNYTDTGLTTGVPYGYYVKARDARHNETGWSIIGYATPAEDMNPPQPNPMTWATVPYATSSQSIRMVATDANDSSGVEYYFDCNESVNPDCHDCNWQADTIYEDSGLDPCTTYAYRVKARDKSTAKNQTGWSVQVSAITLAGGQGPNTPPTIDTNAPMPNPSQWASVPQILQGLDPNYPSGMWYHRMTAVTATDDSPPVMYYFEGLYGGMGSGGWITFPSGQPATYVAGPFLTENRDSAYRVYTKDSATPANNVGTASPTYHLRYGWMP
jgi:predicted outer membrane repeat protein